MRHHPQCCQVPPSDRRAGCAAPARGAPVLSAGVVAVSLLVACSSGMDKAQGVDDADAEDDAWDEDAGGGSFDTGATDDAEPGFSWWRLDADIVIAGGDVDPAESTLNASLLDASGVELCVLEGAQEVVTPSLTLPDELIVAWWTLGGIAWSGDCAEPGGTELLPDTLSLGVGSLHPEIVAVLDSMPEATGGAAGALNGAYAQFRDGETIYVFGAVGPAGAWAGEGAVAESAPLVDGTWELRGAYGFPL